jgi:sterol desaturase/sphingolipid hydroxylase (fatty acid hydroxylase superfamily)
MKPWQNALRYGAWPALVAGSLGATWWAVASRSVDPEGVALLGGLVSGLACWGLELAIPFSAAWRSQPEDEPDARVDAFHAVLGVAIAPVLLRALCLGLLTRASIALGALAGRPAGLWPSRWPLGAQLALALLISELGGYLAHRAQHRVRWLWPMHAIHHAARRVYFFNGLRLHVGDAAITLFTAGFPLVVLGASPPVLVLFYAIANAQFPLQHVNADLRLGPLNYLVSGPELHRWHHSTLPAESEKNYGGLLIVWDLVFGTFFWPKDRREPAKVGLYEGESIPRGLIAQLLWPLLALRGAGDR